MPVGPNIQGGLQVPNSLVLAICGTGGNRTHVQFTVMTLRVQIYETPHISARGRTPDTIGSGVTLKILLFRYPLPSQ